MIIWLNYLATMKNFNFENKKIIKTNKKQIAKYKQKKEVKTLETLCGTIEHITFCNQTNGYTVATLNCEQGSITVVGNMPFLAEGDSVELKGEITNHATYGEQFKVLYCERKAPEGAAAILSYLSSGAIRGVGPATARLIVERFGEDSLKVISETPEELAKIRGISLDKAFHIAKEYSKQFSVRDIMLAFAKFKITPEEALKIYKALGSNAVEIFEKNPYVLCEENIGFGFSRVDEIASFFPDAMQSEYRIAAGIIFVLKHNLSNGHTCLPEEKLISISSSLLNINEENCYMVLEKLKTGLKIRTKIKEETVFIFLPDYYSSEEYCAARISLLLKHPPKAEFAADMEIEFIERELKIEYAELQKKAILTAIKNGITVLTGGPGTGKTTTVNAIIKILQSKKLKIDLCAPTGRAAKRLSEVTKEDAKTIHRLLEVEWDESDKPVFKRNEQNQLKSDVIIVDEMSMVDIKLFESLLKAIKLGSRIILVGDADQLPSVGAGNVLFDIIASNKVPCISLNKIFRQALESLIVTNAHAIINGESPIFNNKSKDFFMIDEFNPIKAQTLVKTLCSERLPAAYKFNPINDIQVLCPSKLMELGSNSLNAVLQEALNPRTNNKKELNFKGVYLREGDKVMQIKNDYDIAWVNNKGEEGSGVFNGDIGILEKIDFKNGIFYIRYDDKLATYYHDNLNEIDLSYAVTIHKSQGSEFECVVLPLLNAPKKLLYRNLLYTAVTRAKKILVIVGSKQTLNEMIANNRKTLRYTFLKEFLTEKTEKIDSLLNSIKD